MTPYAVLTRPISIPRTQLRAPSAALRFPHGAEDVTVSAAPLDALVSGELRTPFPTVSAIDAGICVSYPPTSRYQQRLGPSIIRLDSATTWSIVVGGRAALLDLDVAETSVASMTFRAAVEQCRIALPRPQGTCRITLHAATDVTIERPQDVPVRLEVRRHSSDVTVDDRSIASVPGWSSTTTDGYRDVHDRYLVVVEAAAERLRVGAYDAGSQHALTELWTERSRTTA